MPPRLTGIDVIGGDSRQSRIAEISERSMPLLETTRAHQTAPFRQSIVFMQESIDRREDSPFPRALSSRNFTGAHFRQSVCLLLLWCVRSTARRARLRSSLSRNREMLYKISLILIGWLSRSSSIFQVNRHRWMMLLATRRDFLWISTMAAASPDSADRIGPSPTFSDWCAEVPG
jgi:hypothetical protein